jgi:hypothetical protein
MWNIPDLNDFPRETIAFRGVETTTNQIYIKY